ncbi:hypothetical protein PLEOSDRAFT_23374 [Pleurotus ostreatus PC15]|uniref:C2 domain-containing protein n=1 Tax=Pleurotus ostreatus (strain PC15) TaxID=1137138 RepID=A0A067NTV3_PLEO1|nr:hypothetical protein PLEOSDRAFT_23374 [Pleurotus ostreatus PC15]
MAVIKVQGLSFMRSEKSWRPIVSVEIDQHHRHEVVLGCDGQNPNLKSQFLVHGARPGSTVEVKVWHRSQSKKKKKRNLVATCSHPLRELVKKQESEPQLELRLNCQSMTRKMASKGKPQNGAHIQLRLRPPPSFGSPPAYNDIDAFSDSGCASSSSYQLFPPIKLADHALNWPTDTPCTDSPHRPFIIDTDDEYPLEPESNEKEPLLQECDYTTDTEDRDDPSFDDPLAIKSEPVGTLRISVSNSLSWIAASMLPQYTEKPERTTDISPDLSRAELLLSAFTMYSELKDACLDSQFEKIFTRLQTEWTYIGGLLVALAAVDTAVFAISDDSIFVVDPYARNAIAASSIASGLGISCDAWFLLRYNWADLHTFINRAKDVFDSYFFFAISARVPCFCMLVSAVSLLGFLGRVAYNVWPEGVIVACFFVGMLMTLQFLAKGAVLCVHAASGVRRRVVSGVSWATKNRSAIVREQSEG